MIRSFYYQFVNFIQEMDALWFLTIVVLLTLGVMLCTIKFLKRYNGTQKEFEKVSLIILAILLLAVLIYLVIIRV